MKKKAAPLQTLLRHYLIAIVGAAVLALALRIYVLEAYRISNDFMSPTLLPGDHIFVNKMAYGKKLTQELGLAPRIPTRGDVVILNFPTDPKKDYIKRIIALPGDAVEIRAAVIILNGKAIGSVAEHDDLREHLDNHDYLSRWTGTPTESRNMAPVKVPAGHIFVLGDNRSRGQDSRVWGFVPLDAIKGKAVLIWLSLGNGIRWHRFLTRVN